MNPPAKSKFNPWPIAITVYLMLFFAFTVGIVTYITHQKVDLVRDDYYNDEIRYQKQIDRINRTQGITNEIAVAYNRSRGAITIDLPPAQARQHPAGSIQLYRPSDETLDQEIKLALDPAGRQELDAKSLRAGLWKVRVYWTVDGRDYYFGQSVVVGAKGS